MSKLEFLHNKKPKEVLLVCPFTGRCDHDFYKNGHKDCHHAIPHRRMNHECNASNCHGFIGAMCQEVK